MLRLFILAQILLLIIFAGCGRALTRQTDAVPVKREVLALYDGLEERVPSETRIHTMAELVLNYLGYSLAYRDVRDSLPASKELTHFAAVLTWFNKPPADRLRYLTWAADAAIAGTKFLILEEIGGDAAVGSASPAASLTATPEIYLINDILGALGLRHSGEFEEFPLGAKAIIKKPDWYQFEAPLSPITSAYPVITVVDQSTIPILEIQEPRRPVLAAVGRGGGYIASDYVIYYDKRLDRTAWLINPFAFFQEAIQPPLFPVPDVTTVSGNRLYFSHVDGDGFLNPTRIEGFSGKLSSEVMLEELIAPYPDLPVTIGVIGGDVSNRCQVVAWPPPRPGIRAKAADIARKIFDRPQVEVGSHTCTHPFLWSFYENYDRKEELSLIDKSRGESTIEKGIDALARKIGVSRTRRFDAGSAALPRAYLDNPFDLHVEVEKALEITNALAPAGKRVMVYQWSGNARPFEAAVRETRAAKLLNINGGDTRLDQEFPSVAYVSPIARQVGRERQIYAVNSNENTYTNDWSGPFFGFSNLLETVRNTDSPRRLKGFNVYYHAFSAERLASLNAVKANLDAARRMELTPITTSHYAAIADGFFSTRITTLPARRWSVSERGALNTVRFDDAEGLEVDFQESHGVLGETRHAGSLYVALDAKAPNAIVAVRDRNSARDSSLSRPVLSKSRWLIDNLSYKTACSFSYDAQGFGGGPHIWRTGKQAHYLVTVTRENEEVWDAEAENSNDGMLKIDFPDIAIEPVHIQIDCQPAPDR